MLSTIDGILGVFGVGRGILTFSVGFVDFFVCVFFFDRTPTQIPRTVDDTVSMLLDTLKFITPSIIVFPQLFFRSQPPPQFLLKDMLQLQL